MFKVVEGNRWINPPVILFQLNKSRQTSEKVSRHFLHLHLNYATMLELGGGGLPLKDQRQLGAQRRSCSELRKVLGSSAAGSISHD